MSKLLCANPQCKGKPRPELTHIAIEDTLTKKRYVCPICTSTFSVATRMEPLVQAAPVLTAVVATGSVVLSHGEAFLDGLDRLDRFFDSF